jgi:hypothetical protein
MISYLLWMCVLVLVGRNKEGRERDQYDASYLHVTLSMSLFHH